MFVSSMCSRLKIFLSLPWKPSENLQTFSKSEIYLFSRLISKKSSMQFSSGGSLKPAFGFSFPHRLLKNGAGSGVFEESGRLQMVVGTETGKICLQGSGWWWNSLIGKKKGLPTQLEHIFFPNILQIVNPIRIGVSCQRTYQLSSCLSSIHRTGNHEFRNNEWKWESRRIRCGNHRHNGQGWIKPAGRDAPSNLCQYLFQNSLMAFDVYNNKTLFHRDMPEGVNCIKVDYFWRSSI